MSRPADSPLHPPISRPAAARRHPSTSGILPLAGPAVDRRGFLTTAGAATLAALLASACGGAGDGGDTTGGDGTGPTDPGPGAPAPGAPAPGALPTGVTRDGATLRVELDRVPTLRSVNGFVIVATPATVIVHLGNDDFRAFTARCPHAGCLVGRVESAGIVCPCHGSTFDARDGRVLVGPALEGLRPFPVDFARDTRRLSVTTT